MHTSIFKRFRWGLALGLIALAAAAVGAPGQSANAATTATGVVCSTGTSPNPSFSLTATNGYISMPDGNTVYMWSYAFGGAFQHPGPVLCVNQGDTVTVILNNALAEDTSLIFPGQENVLANNAPAMPKFDGTGKLTSLTAPATA